jgi:DNA-binding transcriptional LysR family regulator
MHLETLRLYCDVVRLRSFSRGAEQNFVSQSAASQGVRQLERDLGLTLIDRTKRPFVVTPKGQALYSACRSVLDTWEQAKAEIAAVKAGVDGTVRVAAIYSVGLHDMSHHLQRFMSLYPNVRVQLECLHPHKVVEAVLNDEADVGVMSYPPAARALAVIPLRAEPMAFVCHPGHRLARRRLVTPPDLAHEPFVAFDRGLTIRKAIDRALRQHGVRPPIVMEFDNIETIKQAIMIQAGVSILPRHTVDKEAGIRTLVVVPFGIPDLVRPVGIIHRRQKPLIPAVSRFIRLLQESNTAGASGRPLRRDGAEAHASEGRRPARTRSGRARQPRPPGPAARALPAAGHVAEGVGGDYHGAGLGAARGRSRAGGAS